MKEKEIHYKNYSKISELKSLNKIDDQFVFYIESLSLEDIIAIKLETFMKSVNYKFFNFPLLKTSQTIVSEALMNVVFGLASNHAEASRMLGINMKQYQRYLSKFGYKINTGDRYE